MLLQIHEPGETPDPHEQDPSLAVGIDLGTTNSVVAMAVDGRPQVLRDTEGGSTLPSVVAYAPVSPSASPSPSGSPSGSPSASSPTSAETEETTEAEVLVGNAARGQLLVAPEQVVSSIKRLMGRGAEDVAELAGTLPFDLAPSAEGGMVRLTVADRRLTPVEISADILRALKGRAEAALGQPVDRAVVTVPAYFDDAARTATKDAARLAGLEVLRLVNEPTAAALAYGLDSGAEGIYAVYDLGGGTFDVSLLRLQKGVFQVLATGGDAALGGDDFDHAIAEHLLAERRTQLGAEAGGAPTAAEAKILLQTARMAKECLTKAEKGDWTVELGDRLTRHHLDRTVLETLIGDQVDRTLDIAARVLADAEIAPEEVAGIVLVGGSTRVPLVRRKVAGFFGQEPLADIDPDHVVALGAALQAEALTRGSDTLLLDVTPLSLGLETMGGLVEKLIARNTPIPVAKAQDFTTYQDGQTAMLIHVLQGERETVDQCRSLARFTLSGLPPLVAGAARITVTFTVDTDGLLTVAASEETQGVRAEVAVKPSYGLTDDEMAKMLRASMENAQQDMERRLLIEARVEANRSLLALDSAIKADGALLQDAERTALEAQAVRIRELLAKTDRDAINDAVEALETLAKPFAGRRMDRAIGAALRGQTVESLDNDMAEENGDHAENHLH